MLTNPAVITKGPLKRIYPPIKAIGFYFRLWAKEHQNKCVGTSNPFKI
jgi:hypothetical protein